MTFDIYGNVESKDIETIGNCLI